MTGKRLFIVSSRLPVIIDEQEGLLPASGGLVSAISSLLGKADASHAYSEKYWSGIPGCSASTWHKFSTQSVDPSFFYIPVFTSKRVYDGFYEGFSNSLIWPLFHYFPSYAVYDLSTYEHYRQVNQHFFESLLKHLRPHDTVWIHDYHLLPLAKLLRSAFPELTIGFFLHIPFPSHEIFRLMPRQWQVDLLEGVLGADLIGFQTIDYAAHFLQSVQMVLGIDHDRHIIRYKDRLVKIDVFPIGIDYERFNAAKETESVQRLRDSYKKSIGQQKMIFSVDRLDYTKGVNNRLSAYEHFLKSFPEYLGEIVFILVVVPSRDHIDRYLERKKMIDGIISQINSRYGSIQWQPVIYQYTHLPFEEMIALYTSCDLALITPLRDGMNLVAKEFVASRSDKRGVLIISEMAGVARELAGALLINPNDIVEIAGMIKKGLDMPEEEQAIRISLMQQRLVEYNVHTWANDFMTELENIKRKQLSYQVKMLDEYTKKLLFDSYRKASNRLILLDYDGTLVPFNANPADAVPDDALIQLLNELSRDRNTVFLISGREGKWLSSYFEEVNIIAEHGARSRMVGDDWTQEVSGANEWKVHVEQIMSGYVRRCPHTFIEEKDFSIVWHYRNANIEQGKLKAAELLAELSEYCTVRPLQAMVGNKVVEVRNAGIDKGTAIKKVLARQNYDFVLAIGDDTTDEDMFKVLSDRSDSFTIKVGSEASFAKYNIPAQQMVLSLLQGVSYLSLYEQ